MSPLERFLKKTSPEPNTGCWLWVGALSDAIGSGKDGYGRVYLGGRVQRAHRYAWILFRGPIPDGVEVCHRCDVTWCVNPGHLFLGTHTDNMRDAKGKGRLRGGPPWGEGNPNAKLSEALIARARALRAAGENYSAIARDVGVSAGTITRALRGLSYRQPEKEAV